MICLSTTVRNDTLQEAKEHRVSLKCRKQLRVEELEMVMPGEGRGEVEDLSLCHEWCRQAVVC